MILPKRCRPNNIILIESRPRAVAIRCRASFFLLSGADDPREGSIRWNAAAEIISTDRPGKKRRERGNAYAVKREREREETQREKNSFEGGGGKKRRERWAKKKPSSHQANEPIFSHLARPDERMNERTDERTDAQVRRRSKKEEDEDVGGREGGCNEFRAT